MVGAVMGPLTEGDPRRIGPFTTVGRLGAGVLGPLYAARSDDGRAVAVRALRAELLADQAVKARLAADIAAARTLAGPYAAPIIAADLEAEAPWVASEYVTGIPLAKVVADHGALPEPTLLSLAAGLAEALAGLHAAGVMHGDLRPETVLLTPDGPRVVDHALARAFDGAVELGTPGFLAPEQALGRTVTPSADMFALGSTLFFAATGRAPFGEGTPEELKKRVAKSSPVLGKLPAAMAELIRGCFQKDANGRAQPRQVVEYVRRRAPIPLGGGWLSPAIAAEVQAAAAGAGQGGAGWGGAAGPGSAAAMPQGVGNGMAFAAAGYGMAPAGTPTVPQPIGAPALLQQPGAPDAAAFHQQTDHSGQRGPGRPGSSRRKLLLALTSGAAVIGGGTAAVLTLGGSSGTTTAAADDAQPSGDSVGAAAPSSPARPLPTGGPLPPPVGAAGTLQGPNAVPSWRVSAVGEVCSLAFGADVLVVCADTGVSGHDLDFTPKWGPVPAQGVAGSGNGVVAGGIAYLIVGANRGGAAIDSGDLLALDVKTGIQKWRSPISQSGLTGTRVVGALNSAVFVVGTVGSVPFLAAVDVADGKPLWQKNGVEFATLAVPADGVQILAIGTQGPDATATCTALDVRTGDQVWARPVKAAAGSGTVSLSKLAYLGDRFVGLLPAAPGGDSLIGGTAVDGLTTWNAALPEPAGDAGTLAFVTRSPGPTSVVALSEHGLYSVDARSGRILWQSQNTESFSTASDAGAPQLADTNVYVYDQTGSWWAVDLPTGRTRWKYPAVAGFAEGAEPVWLAVPGGVVVSAGGSLTMLPAAG